ncbi:restriction endonuclease [Patescibacteria group bacterium]|nr:restriction endonuclease [Patescibacteria group bacterium]MDE1940775.1 restriction endonuclease [Patescibacteria group bacterium]
MNHLVTITKSTGEKELFEEQKLVSSLKRIGAKPEVIEDVVDEVDREIREGMTTADIYRRAFILLGKHSMPMAVKYSIRRAMMELGPDGFPFERFVARIFAMWGYESLTDQTLLGACVDHEVDVVAWKDDELTMVEAKYHNEFGMKSDLKVALYVKARFDDLSETVFNFGGVNRKLSPRGKYLVTNTKFTEKAIKYAECSRLKLLGWNYPAHGNLHEIIEQNGLHPITCLTSISQSQKRDLASRNVMVCIDLVGKPAVLDEIGIRGADAEKVLTEAQIIIEQAK